MLIWRESGMFPSNRFKQLNLAMQRVTLLEDRCMGCVSHSCNKQNRRSRGRKPETKLVVCQLSNITREGVMTYCNIVTVVIHHSRDDITVWHCNLECDIAFIQQFNSLVMLCKKMLKKGDKIDYLSILFGSANKNTSLRIKLSLLPWQRSTHRLQLRQLVQGEGGLADLRPIYSSFLHCISIGDPTQVGKLNVGSGC